MIKYGPILIETSRRYGPRVWDQVKSQKEPAERFVQDKVDKGNQRKKAVQHAETVIDGATLRIFHRNIAHWVVFSGDEPIAVHPRTNAPFGQLLKNADLSKRTRPEEEPPLAQRLRSSARQRRSTSTRTGRAARQHHAHADVNIRQQPPQDPLMDEDADEPATGQPETPPSPPRTDGRP